jgi:sugar phosphate isomerase/epimerase
METWPLEVFLARVKEAGFDGVEMMIPLVSQQQKLLTDLLQQYNLEIIAQNWQPYTTDLAQYLRDLAQRLTLSAEFKPVLINSHTGRDLFSFEQNQEAIDLAQNIARTNGVRILHETHRGRFAYSGLATLPYFRALPDLRITADFSHWCCVLESYLEDQPEVVDEAIRRTEHIHARVGHPEGPQVPDPRAPEWELALHIFLGWWDRIVASNAQRSNPLLTITPEFGPPPYLPAIPFKNQPVADQFELNVFMKNLLTERYRQNPTLL